MKFYANHPYSVYTMRIIDNGKEVSVAYIQCFFLTKSYFTLCKITFYHHDMQLVNSQKFQPNG